LSSHLNWMGMPVTAVTRARMPFVTARSWFIEPVYRRRSGCKPGALGQKTRALDDVPLTECPRIHQSAVAGQGHYSNFAARKCSSGLCSACARRQELLEPATPLCVRRQKLLEPVMPLCVRRQEMLALVRQAGAGRQELIVPVTQLGRRLQELQRRDRPLCGSDAQLDKPAR
jgi:hypothetical protein